MEFEDSPQSVMQARNLIIKLESNEDFEFEYEYDSINFTVSKDEVSFLISLLSSNHSRVRNRVSLTLMDLKIDEAVPYIVNRILDSDTYNANGTMVYSLEELNCENYISKIIKILCTQGWEARTQAFIILKEKAFSVTNSDKIEMKNEWEKYLSMNKAEDYFETQDISFIESLLE